MLTSNISRYSKIPKSSGIIPIGDSRCSVVRRTVNMNRVSILPPELN
jgi:hypothetical protein